MNPTVLAALSAAGLAGGCLLVAVGIRPATAVGAPSVLPTRISSLFRRFRRRLAGVGVGLLAGVAAWLFTGWLVLVAAVPAAVVGVPFLLGGARQGRERIDRLEAVEEWVRGLSSRLAAGIGLEQTLAASADKAPERIAVAVRRLATRLRQGQHVDAALRALAHDLDSATGDQVVAQLLLACQRRGPGAAEALRELAGWVADDVAHLRSVEAERARPRFTARAVTVIAVAAFTLMAVVGDYMAPYATARGQLVLVGILAAFTGALVWMRRITTAGPEHRLLVGAERKGV